MGSDLLPTIAAVLVTVTAVLLFLTTDWRVNISLLAFQYLGVFVFATSEWPLAMAVSKLVAGWIAGAVLGLAISGIPELKDSLMRRSITPRLRVSRLFPIFSAILIGLAIYSRFASIAGLLPDISQFHAWGALILIGMGLLKLGFTVRPFPNIVGILTALSGFEILHAALVKTPLMAGLHASLTLGIALVGSYLLLAPFMDELE